MKIQSKYKIARKLGAAVFEKTQTAKFALSEQKKKIKKFSRPKTNYGVQLSEKQKVRFHYAITDKQLKNYVKAVLASKMKNPAEGLYQALEKRVDSLILRSGFAKTRFQAKQAASHGHFQVNGRKITIPSMQITPKDTIKLKESKKDSPLYLAYSENFKDIIVPTWIIVDPKENSISLKGEPVYNQTENPFNLSTVIQFYNR
jgi:small subunit ribosomal protein S4